MSEKIKTRKDWDLTQLPPEGDRDVGPFFYELWENAAAERERLGLADRWMQNHKLFRGDHWDSGKKGMWSKEAARKVTVNLFFANATRTVANLTAAEPESEVVEVHSPDAPYTPASLSSTALSNALTTYMRRWWNETEQARSLTRSAMNMEIYGISVEKAVWDADKSRMDSVVVDPFAWFPAPGYVDDINDLPYIAHAYAMRTDEVERLFGVEGIEADDVYSVLGEEREDNRPIHAGTRRGSGNFPGNYAPITHPAIKDPDYREKRALVIELWIRDHATVTEEVQVGVDLESGERLVEKVERPKYPGGIRVVTLTNGGRTVLADRGNPNINTALPENVARHSYLFDRFPFTKMNSYEDSTSIWGFSAAEQVSDLNLKINELISRIANYLGRLMLPTLILPKDSGITLDQLNNRPGLVLQPISSMAAQQIRYLTPPNLPSNFLDLLHTYLNMYDKVSQIQDVDRGQAPGQVIAASAIQALQERGAVLQRAKIRSIDYMVRERGRAALSYFQNFGLEAEPLEMGSEMMQLRGVDLAGRRIDYVVESGSTIHRTTAQIQEQAERLYEVGAIDRQALLEAINFPKWKQVVERVGEGQLQQALQVLQQAGLSEEDAAALQQYLMEPQGGPGGTAQNQPNSEKKAVAKQGTPKAQQGQDTNK